MHESLETTHNDIRIQVHEAKHKRHEIYNGKKGAWEKARNGGRRTGMGEED